MVRKRRPPTVKSLPGCPGLAGLMVATSSTGFAFARMGFGGGGSGMVHAVALVARVRLSGRGLGPWVQVPAIEFPSELSFPHWCRLFRGLRIHGRALLSDGAGRHARSRLVDAVEQSLEGVLIGCRD
jgi:hypothetical protein